MTSHRRFYVDPGLISNDVAVLDRGTAHQISRVLRLTVGDSICLFDGSGKEYVATLESLSKDQATARIVDVGHCPLDPQVNLTLAVCLPKADKLELIVQKTTELGISHIIVVDSERTVAKPERSKVVDRLERWRRIAKEAAEQCGRATVPEVTGIIEFEDLPAQIKHHNLALLAWEDENCASVKETLAEHEPGGSVLLIVGPEGGLTYLELELAKSAGAKCVSLGKRVLRAETAAVAGVAVLMHELED